MDEFRLFVEMYRDAVGRTFSHPKVLIFALLATVFGTTIPGLFQSGAPFESYADALAVFFDSHPVSYLIIPVSAMIVTGFSAALTYSLNDRRLGLYDSVRAARTAFSRLFGIKIALFIFSLIALILLCLPGLISSRQSSALSEHLLLAGFMLFLPIFAIFAFTEAFASLHVILSGTDFLSSIRLGYALFVRRISTSIVFALLSFLIIVLASVIVDLFLIATSRLMSDTLAKAAIISLFIVIFQSVFLSVRTAAFLSFFFFINTSPQKEAEAETSQNPEKVIQKEVPEIG